MYIAYNNNSLHKMKQKIYISISIQFHLLIRWAYINASQMIELVINWEDGSLGGKNSSFKHECTWLQYVPSDGMRNSALLNQAARNVIRNDSLTCGKTQSRSLLRTCCVLIQSVAYLSFECVKLCVKTYMYVGVFS